MRRWQIVLSTVLIPTAHSAFGGVTPNAGDDGPLTSDTPDALDNVLVSAPHGAGNHLARWNP